MLEISQITMQFGGLVALNDVNMSIKHGEIHGLIGPNGSGKTTLINVITGFYSPTEGTIKLDGKTISGRQPYEVASMGVCRTFQNINLFGRMTALENVMTAASVKQTANLFSAIMKTPKLKSQECESRNKAIEILEFVGLADKQDIVASCLPYGKQRLLEISRALATEPRLLLLDEPVCGMNDFERDETAALIHRLREKGLTILLIEHHMKFVMNLCDIITVLNYGAIIGEGAPNLVQNDEAVINTYLGKRKMV